MKRLRGLCMSIKACLYSSRVTAPIKEEISVAGPKILTHEDS